MKYIDLHDALFSAREGSKLWRDYTNHKITEKESQPSDEMTIQERRFQDWVYGQVKKEYPKTYPLVCAECGSLLGTNWRAYKNRHTTGCIRYKTEGLEQEEENHDTQHRNGEIGGVI